MKTIPVTQAQQDLYNIIDETISSSVPVQILSKRGGVVLISTEDWNALQETLYLSSVKGFEKSLKDADNDEWVTEDKVDW